MTYNEGVAYEHHGDEDGVLGGKHVRRHIRKKANPSFSAVMVNKGNE